jgi:hypothetical protein
VSFLSTDLLFFFCKQKQWKPLGTIYIGEGDRSLFERRRDIGEHGKLQLLERRWFERRRHPFRCRLEGDERRE